MNSRHAAALALVGWYLMYPPGRYEPDRKAPLSQWRIAVSFDTAKECEGVLREEEHRADNDPAYYDKLLKNERDPQGYVTVETWKARLKYSSCISTDDPRLKEK